MSWQMFSKTLLEEVQEKERARAPVEMPMFSLDWFKIQPNSCTTYATTMGVSMKKPAPKRKPRPKSKKRTK